MPTAPIPFVNQQAGGLEELGGASPFAMNVLTDPNGVVRKRPGLNLYEGAVVTQVDAAGLSAIYLTLNDDVIAVGAAGAERPIYRVTVGAAAKLGGGVPGTGLRGASRPTIAETEMLLVFAGGEEMQRVELATWNSARLGGSPPYATHVIANSSRLLANDTPTAYPSRVRFSDVATGKASYANHEVWSYGGVGASGYFDAVARPDPVVAVTENTNEVFVFGTGTTQVYAPQADLSYPFVPAATREVGCSAPYSVVKVDQDFLWLDHKRRFVKSDGRSFDVISDPIQLTLDDMGYSADCWGFPICEGPFDAVIWVFPTDGRTFVYQKKSGWGQWAGWSGSNWAPYPVMSARMLQHRSDMIVGTTDGYVRKIDLHAKADHNGPIRACVRTGFINRDTEARKQCKRIWVTLRRGDALDGVLATIRFRDEPNGPWSDALPIDLGGPGNRTPVVQFNSLGTYRRRQWEFEFSGAYDVSLVKVDEEFTVLEA